MTYQMLFISKTQQSLNYINEGLYTRGILSKNFNGHEEGSGCCSLYCGSEGILHRRMYFITYKGICISLLHGKSPCFG